MTKQQIEKLGYKFYGDEKVLKNAPKKIKGTLEYFKIGKFVTSKELQDEYEKRGLVSASMEDIFDETHDCAAIQWKDKKGNWCFAAFGRWDGESGVSVDRFERSWRDFWWFAGIRKSLELEMKKELPKELVINGIKYKRA